MARTPREVHIRLHPMVERLSTAKATAGFEWIEGWHHSTMDPLRFLCRSQGFFTRSQARSTGYDDRDIARAVRSKVWHRVRRGYYVYADTWAPLDTVGRHLVRCRCVLDSLGPTAALSHVSGTLAHGISVWDMPLEHVHVTRLDGGAGRIEAGVVHHEGLCLTDEVVEIDGMRVLTPERCVLEAGSRVDNEHALVLMDSLLHRGLSDEDRLAQRFEVMGSWPFIRHLHIPVRMATGKAESPGESRGRWLFWALGLPAPICQFEVYDATGVLRGTCDWGWPERKQLGEFDGRSKYGRLLRPGQDPGHVVFAEKQREDELRELTGYSMIRLTWDDYERPRLTAQRLERKLRRAG